MWHNLYHTEELNRGKKEEKEKNFSVEVFFRESLAPRTLKNQALWTLVS